MADQYNPFGKRGLTVVNLNYKEFFETVFNQEVRGAEKLFKERIKQRLCNEKTNKPKKVIWDNEKLDVDISPEGRWGRKQNAYEKFIQIGSFSFKIEPIYVTWSKDGDKCCFNALTIMYVEDQTGADKPLTFYPENIFSNNPVLPAIVVHKGWNFLDIPAHYSGLFEKRIVRMGEWGLDFSDCCENGKSGPTK
jgi:hypothetical protein